MNGSDGRRPGRREADRRDFSAPPVERPEAIDEFIYEVRRAALQNEQTHPHQGGPQPGGQQDTTLAVQLGIKCRRKEETLQVTCPAHGQRLNAFFKDVPFGFGIDGKAFVQAARNGETLS